MLNIVVADDGVTACHSDIMTGLGFLGQHLNIAVLCWLWTPYTIHNHLWWFTVICGGVLTDWPVVPHN